MPDSSITKRVLEHAFKELLEREPFERISVSSICEMCGLNRKSFYYHFRDKYELVEWIYNTEFIAVMRAENAEINWDFIERLCAYFADNRSFYAKMLAYEGQNSFSSYFHDVVTVVLQRAYEDLSRDGSPIDDDTARFMVGFYADALTTAIKNWIRGGCTQEPHEFVCLLKTCIYGVPRPMDADALGKRSASTEERPCS